MEKARLLVIDDNENLVDMIEEYFSDHEFIKVVLKHIREKKALT